MSRPRAAMDYPAVLARTEQMLYFARESYVCAAWKLDEEAAARSLRYLRSLADGLPDDDNELQAFVEFVRTHGQSSDWLLFGDVGSMICGAAGRSERAAANDPIF